MENLGLIARLSSETQLHHPQVDAPLERLLAHPTATAYRAWLLCQHGLLAPLEAAFETTPHLAEIIDLRARRKVPRIRADLLALGVRLPQIAAAPTCTAIPGTFARAPAALGWMYAVERPVVQHGHAYRQLARALPGEIAFASSYLKCYETSIGVMWRALATTIEAACATPESAAELFAAAHEAFRCMRRWDHHATSDVGHSTAVASQRQR